MNPVARVPVPNRAFQLAGLDRVDYADCFAVDVPAQHTPLHWIHVALDDSPQLFRAVHYFQQTVLGLNLAPRRDPEHPLGWDVLLDTATEAMAGSDGSFGHGRIVGLTPPGKVVLASIVELGGLRGRSLWTFGQYAHRAVARHALTTIGKLASTAATTR